MISNSTIVGYNIYGTGTIQNSTLQGGLLVAENGDLNIIYNKVLVILFLLILTLLV